MGALSAAPEADVVILAKAGDTAAFRELVLRRQSPLRDLLRKLSGDAALGDDLAQETFVQAWKSLRSLEAPGAFGGWLRRIAVNTWLAEARRARLPMGGERDLENLPDAAASPERRIDLLAALARLSAPERLCVVLSHAEGLTHGEIVEITGLPLGTVKSHVRRGGDKLKRILAMDGGDD